MRVIRDPRPGLAGHDLLEPPDEPYEVSGREVRVRLDAPLCLRLLDGFLEESRGCLQHDLAERLDEAPVGIPSEAFIIRAPGETTDCGVVQAEVQDGVHHPRHGDRRAAPYRYQQGIFGVSEPPARGVLQTRQVLFHLVHQALWHLPGLYVMDAGLCCDDEALRHREAEAAHPHEPRAFPPAESEDIRGPHVVREPVDEPSGLRNLAFHLAVVFRRLHALFLSSAPFKDLATGTKILR